MMLPPDWRADSPARTRLAWFNTTLNDRFGVAMAYAVSHGWAVVSFVRKKAAVPAGLVCRHSMTFIQSPGLTGRSTCAPDPSVIREVTFWPGSTVIST